MKDITISIDVLVCIILSIVALWFATIFIIKCYYYDIHLKLEDYKELKEENEQLKKAIELIKGDN